MAKVNSGKMTLEDHYLPGTVPEKDLYFPDQVTKSDIELDLITPIKPKGDNNADDEATNAALPTKYEMWKSFVSNTSLHGIRYVFWRRPLWARIGWLLILLAFTAYFLFTAQKSLKKYYARPINTVITQKYVSSLEFPAVTICPQNLVSKKKMYALDGDESFVKYGLNDSVCTATESVRDGKPCGAAMVCCCLPFFLLDSGKIVLNCTTPYLLSLIAAQQNSGIFFDTKTFYEKYSQGVEEMLESGLCIFDATLDDPCGASDFTPFVTDWGVCHTFNAGLGGPDSIKKAQLTGPGGGLNILLNSQIDDHTIGRLSEGFSVIIHRQGDFFIPWDGINVGPGTQASITLHQQRIKNLEDPYESKCKDKKLKTFSAYTTAGCHYECLAERIIKSCKCRPVGFSGTTSIRTCAKFDQICVMEQTGNLDISDCDCPVPCNEIRYTTEVYYSKFPDAGSAAVMQAEGWTESSFKHMRENSVFLQIGYKTLSYELQEQQVAFGVEALFGEIGGNMGLFLGCSLMTVFEFADLLVALVYVRALHKEYPS
ncbi:hypothetical protein ACROYT_G038976 [Oculina patagonica]